MKLINNWNKTAKIKSLIILILSFMNLYLIDFGLDYENESEFSYVILVLYFFTFSILLPIILKFLNLFGFTFKGPNWNDSFLTIKLSYGLNFFHFFAIFSIVSGLLNFLFILTYSRTVSYEFLSVFFAGIFLILGIEIYLKIQKSKKPTV